MCKCNKKISSGYNNTWAPTCLYFDTLQYLTK